MNRFVTAVALVIATSGLVAGCTKGSGDGAGAASSSAASAKPSATTTASAAANLPQKGPWEALKLTMTKKDPDGSEHFRIDNLGAKTVTNIFIDMYGYDAKGKQVIHKDRSYGIPIKGGASAEFTQDPVKDVDTWEAVYHGLEFEGDAAAITDLKRAPAQRAKGSS